MTTPRKLQPTIYISPRDAAGMRHVLQVWKATGAVPVAHIVAEPEITEDLTIEEPIAA
jgi:hypothetical protein